jgi:hypothetical protein
MKIRLLLAVLLNLHWSAGVLAAPKPKPEPFTVDVGAYRVNLMLDHRWRTEFDKEAGYVVLNYANTPKLSDATIVATICLFRFVVPAEARGADRLELAAAFAIKDVTGAQKALFGTSTRLVRSGRNGESIKGGTVVRYVEPVDRSNSREKGTLFVRAVVFFPDAFPNDGALFLLVGKHDSHELVRKPEELEMMSMVLAGIQTGAASPP